MTEKDVVRKVMNMRGWSQPKLAIKAGFKSQSNITGLLNNNKNGIRIDNLFKMLDAMGCEIVVRDKMGSEQEWVIDMVSEPKYPMPDEDRSPNLDQESVGTTPSAEKKSSGKRIKLTPAIDLDALLADDEPDEPVKPAERVRHVGNSIRIKCT